MDALIRINAIESRAEALRVTLWDLSGRRMKLYAAFRRWQSGGGYNGRVFEEVCSTLEAELARLERGLLPQLVALHPAEARIALAEIDRAARQAAVAKVEALEAAE